MRCSGSFLQPQVHMSCCALLCQPRHPWCVALSARRLHTTLLPIAEGLPDSIVVRFWQRKDLVKTFQGSHEWAVCRVAHSSIALLEQLKYGLPNETPLGTLPTVWRFGILATYPPYSVLFAPEVAREFA